MLMARRSRPRSSSGLPYLVVGLSIGLAVAAGVYFSDLRSGAGVPTSSRASNAERPASQASAAEPQRAASPSRETSRTSSAAPSRSETPSYEFYDVLPR